MYVLDTDVLSLLEEPRGDAARRLQSRLDNLPADQVVTTIITYEEQTRGWFAILAKAKSAAAQVGAIGVSIGISTTIVISRFSNSTTGPPSNSNV